MDGIIPAALLLASCFVIAGGASVSVFARSARAKKQIVSFGDYIVAFLNSGWFGFGLSAGVAWYKQGQVDLLLLLLLWFLSAFCGLGGYKALEISVNLFWRILPALVEKTRNGQQD